MTCGEISEAEHVNYGVVDLIRDKYTIPPALERKRLALYTSSPVSCSVSRANLSKVSEHYDFSVQ
jgi:hypothetical protein